MIYSLLGFRETVLAASTKSALLMSAYSSGEINPVLPSEYAAA
jgi:hypothetical protein